MQPRDYWILVLNSLIYLIAQLNVELQPFIAEALTLLAHIIHRTSIGYPMVHFPFVHLL